MVPTLRTSPSPPQKRFKTCVQCREPNLALIRSRLKRCLTCQRKTREKGSAKAAEWAGREALKARSLNANDVGLGELNSDDEGEERGKTLSGRKKAVKANLVKRVKLCEMGDEERQEVIRILKAKVDVARVKRTKASKKLWAGVVGKQHSKYEVVSLNELYQCLARKIVKCAGQQKLLKFRAVCSIVAAPSESLGARLEDVVRDFRQIAPLSFQMPGQLKTDVTLASFEFPCACLGLNGLSGESRPLSSGNPPARYCGGRISVSVVQDNTHPFVAGHRVTVRVIHS